MTHHDSAADRGKSINKFALASLAAGALACIACTTPIAGIDSLTFASVGLALGLIGLAGALLWRRSSIAMPFIGIAICLLGLVLGDYLDKPPSAIPQKASAAASGQQAKAQTAPPRTPGAGLRRAGVISAEYLGHRMTDYGAPELRFRLSNNTGKAVASCRGSVMVLDAKTAEPVLGLYLDCIQPIAAGDSATVARMAAVQHGGKAPQAARQSPPDRVRGQADHV